MLLIPGFLMDNRWKYNSDLLRKHEGQLPCILVKTCNWWTYQPRKYFIKCLLYFINLLLPTNL